MRARSECFRDVVRHMAATDQWHSLHCEMITSLRDFTRDRDSVRKKSMRRMKPTMKGNLPSRKVFGNDIAIRKMQK